MEQSSRCQFVRISDVNSSFYFFVHWVFLENILWNPSTSTCHLPVSEHCLLVCRLLQLLSVRPLRPVRPWAHIFGLVSSSGSVRLIWWTYNTWLYISWRIHWCYRIRLNFSFLWHWVHANSTGKDSRQVNGYQNKSTFQLSFYGIFGVYSLLKILLLDEVSDSAWNSPCSQTRFQFWLLFGTLIGSITIAIVAIFCLSRENSSEVIGDNNNSEETEPLLQNPESHTPRKGRSLKRLLAESIPDLHLLCLAFI